MPIMRTADIKMKKRRTLSLASLKDDGSGFIWGEDAQMVPSASTGLSPYFRSGNESLRSPSFREPFRLGQNAPPKQEFLRSKFQATRLCRSPRRLIPFGSRMPSFTNCMSARFATALAMASGIFAGSMRSSDILRTWASRRLWLMPFYPSPMRDDGYDIADYFSVNPSYGT